MHDLKSDANAALIISTQKICSAYKRIFSELNPDYHKADFEVNKRSLVIALLNELQLPTSLKKELISAIEISWIPQSSPEDLLGVDYKSATDIIGKFLEELETEIKSSRDLTKSIFEYSLDLVSLSNDHSIGNDPRIESVEVLPEIRSKIENYLLNGTYIGPSENNESHSSRMNQKLSQLKFTTNKTQGHNSLRFNITKEKLKAALDEGKSYKECAEMFGCSYRTIAYYAKTYSLSKSKNPTLTKDVLEYYLMRMTPTQCAEKLGYHYTSIRQSMKRFGLKTDLLRSSQEIDKRTLNLIRDFPGISADDLIAKSRSDRSTISKSLNRMIDKSLIRFGYATKYVSAEKSAKSSDNEVYNIPMEKSVQFRNNELYNIIKNNPGICADKLAIQLNKSKEYILISVNKLISNKLVQIGYIVGNNSEDNAKKYIQSVDQEASAKEGIDEDSSARPMESETRIQIEIEDKISFAQESSMCKLLCSDSHDWIKKGNYLLRLGNINESINCYNIALDIDPFCQEAWHNRGFALMKLCRYEQAITCYNKAIEINPHYALAWYYEGFTYFILGQYENALYYYDNAINIDPSLAKAWQSRGYVLHKLDHFIDSIKSFDMALEENPSCADAWYNKGVVFKKLGYYAEALKAYDEALNIYKFDPRYWNNKGVVLKNLGRYEEALTCYDKVILLGHMDTIVLNNKGNAFYGLRKYEDAIIYYNKAIELDPNNFIILYNKAISLNRLGRINEAIELYRIINIAEPKFVRAWINKGFAYKNLSQHNEAIECFDRAIVLEPSIGKLWCYEGEVLNTMGNYLEANRCYNKAIELNPELAEAWNGSGLALAGLGQYIDARKAFLKAKSLGYS
ncbi:MAG: tetratricopeptide repeat protein [Methanothrix sp.]|nr:tetratricopeptide repeat protein [Methanothrix sp.]